MKSLTTMTKSEKDLYRQTRDDRGIIRTPQWALGLDYDGKFYEFSWCKVSKEDQPEFSMYDLRILVDDESKNFDNFRDLFNIVKKVRMKEVYDGYVESEMIETIVLNAVESVDQMDIEKVAVLVNDLYQRVDEGEFVGQALDMIYVQEVAEILQCDVRTVLKAIDEVLVPERRLSLNGMIMSEFKDPEIGRKIMEERTGHKDISISDFGAWHCAVCGKDGDDRDNPKDFECK